MSDLFMSRPSPATLTELFGLPVPADFVTFLDLIYEYAHGDQDRCETLFSAVYGEDALEPSYHYDRTPPELFTFSSTGGDGQHGGFVIHAPELKSAEYPIGIYDPSITEGMELGGETFRVALARRLTDLPYLMDEGDEELRKDAENLLDTLVEKLAMKDVALPAEILERHTHPYYGGPIVPQAPTGWRHVQTGDGVGVLAPTDKFAKGDTPAISEYAQIDEIQGLVDKAITDGFPATALMVAREALRLDRFGDMRSSPVDAAKGREILAKAYEALNRPVLADRARRYVLG